MPALPIPNTYKDGIGAERCLACHTLLRDPAGEARVPIRLVDVEELALFLEDYVECPEVWAPMIQRLEAAAGRRTSQMRLAERVK